MRPEEMVGLTLDHYRIIKPIGRGGMATVFLAQDIYLQRKVAVKIFEPKTSESDIFWQRFAREAQVVAQLDHPNILMVHEYGEHNGFAYFIMPYLELGSLRDRLRQSKILPLRETIDIITQILQALQYAHECGLIHRDIKPDNILFKTEIVPVLSDFGLVKVVDNGAKNALLSSTVTQSAATIVGTPQYMAPEQIQGKPTPASDIYSMGVVLYEMLTGIPPFVADNAMRVLTMHLYERPRPLHELNPAILSGLEAVVLRALEKDEAARYQQPKDFLQALAQVSVVMGNAALPMSPIPVVLKNNIDRTEIRQRSESSSLPARGQQGKYDGYGAPRGSYSTVAFQAAVSTPIVSPVRHKRLVFQPVLLIALLTGVVLFASFGIWYGVPYLQAKGIFGLAPVATAKPSSRNALVLKTTAPVSSASTSTSAGLATVQTACPAKGNARAAILPPLLDAQENHQNVVYVSNRSYQTQPVGSLIRYDAESGRQIPITEVSNVEIKETQISADGQWILFVSHFVQMQGRTFDYAIQMVRIDGKELQTLYCADGGIVNIALSPFSSNASNALNRVIFTENGQSRGVSTTYMLNLNNGSLQQEKQSGNFIGWRDANSFYLRDDTSQHNVYLLDLTTDTKQLSTNNLHFITSSSGCDDFSPDVNGFDLYISSCVGSGVTTRFCEPIYCPPTSGPSTISVWRSDGRTQQYQKRQLLSTDNTMAVVQIRVISNQMLLALVANSGTNKAKNGVWKLTLSTGKWQLLVPDTFSGAYVMLNAGSSQPLANSPLPWSNVSRDGQKYAVRVASPQSLGYDALYLGAMDGSNRQKFASSVNGAQLFIAGWITM